MFRLAVSAVLLSVLAIPVRADTCRDDVVKLRGSWGQARFSVEIAESIRERSRGLMFRESLPTSGGMLFIYRTPSPVSFWMKNTLIPLDMIFLDERGVVRKVHHEAVPGDLTQIHGGQAILAVLEINGGLARAMGIAEGTEVQHPAFGVDAAWPCE